MCGTLADLPALPLHPCHREPGDFKIMATAGLISPLSLTILAFFLGRSDSPAWFFDLSRM